MYNNIVKTLFLPFRMAVMPIAPVLGAMAAGAGSALVGGLLGGGKGATTETAPILKNVSGGGLFDTSIRGGKGQISLTPEMQGIQQGMFGQAAGSPLGQQATDLAGGLFGQAGTDPNVMAQQQFQRMEDILNPMRDQQRAEQESRLFAQGRLGSTGGALDQQAFEQAIQQQQAQGLFDAMGQAQDIQGNQMNRGLALGQFAPQQQTQALQNLLNMQQGAQSQLTGQGVQTQMQQPTFGQQIGTGLMMGGTSLMGQGVQGIPGMFSGGQGTQHGVGTGASLGYDNAYYGR